MNELVEALQQIALYVEDEKHNISLGISNIIYLLKRNQIKKELGENMLDFYNKLLFLNDEFLKHATAATNSLLESNELKDKCKNLREEFLNQQDK